MNGNFNLRPTASCDLPRATWSSKNIPSGVYLLSCGRSIVLFLSTTTWTIGGWPTSFKLLMVSTAGSILLKEGDGSISQYSSWELGKRLRVFYRHWQYHVLLCTAGIWIVVL